MIVDEGWDNRERCLYGEVTEGQVGDDRRTLIKAHVPCFDPHRAQFHLVTPEETIEVQCKDLESKVCVCACMCVCVCTCVF